MRQCGSIAHPAGRHPRKSVRTRLSAGGRWIRTSGSWSRDRQTVMGEVTAFSKPGADLLGNRRFESISLQRGVSCEPHLWDPDSNELAIEAVRKYPDRFAIMGWFYLDDPNGRDIVARWKERPGMLGLRFYFNERTKRGWIAT